MHDVYEGDNHLGDDFSRSNRKPRNAVGYYIMRAAYIFRLYGDNRHAEYLEGLAQQHFLSVWGNRAKVGVQFGHDPKFQHLIQAAAAAGRDTTPYGSGEI